MSGKAESREKRGRPERKKIITSWFAIALDEIRTRRILREKADCKQSNSYPTRIFCRVCLKPGIRKKKTKQNKTKIKQTRVDECRSSDSEVSDLGLGN